MEPLISVITANYNKAAFLEETLGSLLNQTYANWELILVDDCSTDNSLEVIAGFLDDKRIVFTRNEINRGGNFCRNLALKLAKGSFILFLDADDLLAAHCLEGRLKVAQSFPEKNLLVFSMGVFLVKPGDLKAQWVPRTKHALRDFLEHSLPWSIMQPFWKKEFILALGGFDESFSRLQDVELNTRALLSPAVAYQLVPSTADCFYRVDESRKSFNAYTFMSRWVDSALKYCDKIGTQAPERLKHYLLGTVYQTYFQVLYHFKLKQLDHAEFEVLEQKLLGYSMVASAGFVKRKIFSVSKWYNLHFFRIPGFNRFLKSCLVA